RRDARGPTAAWAMVTSRRRATRRRSRTVSRADVGAGLRPSGGDQVRGGSRSRREHDRSAPALRSRVTRRERCKGRRRGLRHIWALAGALGREPPVEPPESLQLLRPSEPNDIGGERLFGPGQERGKVAAEDQAATEEVGLARQVVRGPAELPEGMPAEHVIFATVVELDQVRMGLGRFLLALMDQQRAPVRPRLPAMHPRRQCGQEVHAALPAGLVAADRLETLAPEQLERSGNLFEAGEAIIVARTLFPGIPPSIGAGYAEPGVSGALAEEVCDVVWLEGHIRVAVPDEHIGQVTDAGGASIERMHLAGEVTLLPFVHP